MTLELESFLKEAFCIDGEAKFKGTAMVLFDGESSSAGVFELTDSKRGIFTVTMSSKSNGK